MATFYDGDGFKSIPLNALPEEAWTYVFGGPSSDVYSLYKSVPWLYRGTNLRADAVASMPYALYKSNGDEVENPEQDTRNLPFWRRLPMILNLVEGDRVLYGAAYLYREKNKYSISKGLRRFAPMTIKLDTDDEIGLKGFKRQIGGGEKLYKPNELIYFWLPNRNDEIGPGVSPVAAALVAAGAINSADEFVKSMFARGLLKALLVSVKDSAGTGVAPLPEADRTRLQEWLERLRGVKNSFTAKVVGKELKVDEVGTNPKDAAMPELTEQKRQDIATALGVPSTLLFSGNATGLGGGGVAEQDDLHFYDKTIKPECREIQETLNEQLFEPLGYEFKFHPERLEIYQALEAQKADKVIALYNAKLISKNEGRDQMGYEPIDGGDDLTDDKPEPVQQEELPAQVVEGTARETMPAEAEGEVRKWLRYSVRRHDEGKPEKALGFQSESIPASLKAAIEGGLEAAGSVDDVRRIFSDALTWQAYP